MTAVNPAAPRFAALALALRALALFAIVTGLIDVLFGTWFLSAAGANPGAAATDAATDGQLRFLSAMWVGYGVSLWWVAANPMARGQALAVLAGMCFLGGLGRLLAVILHGVPAPVFLIFLATELIFPVALVLWHRAIAARTL